MKKIYLQLGMLVMISVGTVTIWSSNSNNEYKQLLEMNEEVMADDFQYIGEGPILDTDQDGIIDTPGGGYITGYCSGPAVYCSYICLQTPKGLPCGALYRANVSGLASNVSGRCGCGSWVQ